MDTTEQVKEELRKIQTTGEDGQSYPVTLPKELVDKLGWRKGQKVTVKKYGGGLLIKDWAK